MAKNKKAYFLRHGLTDEDLMSQNSGWNEEPINKKGVKEAKATAKHLKKKPLDYIVTSPINRAAQTASVISKQTGKRIYENPNLSAWNLGQYASQPEDLFDEEYYVNNPDEPVPGGESFNTFKNRMLQGMADVEGMPGNPAIVTHSKGLQLLKALERNKGQWNDKAVKDYLTTDTPDKEHLFEMDMPKAKAGLTAKKAREILHDKSVHGKPLTDKQRKFFGWIAGGGKAQAGETLYVSDPNNPRLRAYNDSLNLYKQNFNQLKGEKKSGEPIQFLKRIPFSTKDDRMYAENMYEKNDIWDTRSQGEVYPEKIKPIYFDINRVGDKTQHSAYYKKPVQSVEYVSAKQPVTTEQPKPKPKKQVAQEQPTIYTDNPNDPRLKAYQDSLSLYNWRFRNPDREHSQGIQYYNTKKERRDYVRSLNEMPSYLLGTETQTKNLLNRINRTGYLPIGRERVEGELPVYKKPVQPVKYQKPEPKKETPVQQKVIPQSKPIPSPTPQTEYSGTPIYAPTPYSPGAGALVGFRSAQGDTTYIQPQDYQRFAVPKYGQEYIKSQKRKGGGGVIADRGKDIVMPQDGVVQHAMSPSYQGLGYSNKGYKYNSAWGGRWATGGTLPGAPGSMYSRGDDWQPKMISQSGSEVPVDSMGYWNPENYGKQVVIPTNKISMEDMEYPVLGVSDTGDAQLMQPGGQYEFDGNNVLETPVDKQEDEEQTTEQDRGQLKKLDQLTNFTNYNEMKKARSGIYIKPSKKGTFTAAAKKRGMGVQAFASKVLANKEDYSSAMVKKANFARNAAKWKHEGGGYVEPLYTQQEMMARYGADIEPFEYHGYNDTRGNWHDPGLKKRWAAESGGYVEMGGTHSLRPLPGKGNQLNEDITSLPGRMAGTPGDTTPLKGHYYPTYGKDMQPLAGKQYPMGEDEKPLPGKAGMGMTVRMQSGGTPTNANGDSDGEMARGQIRAMHKYLDRLEQSIGEGDNLEPWVNSKITLADDYLGTIADYLGYSEGGEKGEEGGEEEYGSGGGIPQRYKNMGFSRVGQKKAGDGKHKWKVLAKKGDKYKVVQGGWRGMKDFSQHHSEKRKDKFWSRMGGKNSSKAKDPFSPLYWHKRLGTWESGGMIDDQMEGGGNMPDNPGFRALPENVQKKILANMEAGGKMPAEYARARFEAAGNEDMLKDYGYARTGIHIAPEKKGTFTAAATKHDMGVQEFASHVLSHPNKFSGAMRKKANFARNAAKWKKGQGGFAISPETMLLAKSAGLNVGNTGMFNAADIPDYSVASANLGGTPSEGYVDRTSDALTKKRSASTNKRKGLDVGNAATAVLSALTYRLQERPNWQYLDPRYSSTYDAGQNVGTGSMAISETGGWINGNTNGVPFPYKSGIMFNYGGTAAENFGEDKEMEYMAASGQMIKRKDGSYSRRGLWDNIRAAAARNKRAGKKGKKPTAEMLRQERKIKAKEANYGMDVTGKYYPQNGEIMNVADQDNPIARMGGQIRMNHPDSYDQGGELTLYDDHTNVKPLSNSPLSGPMVEFKGPDHGEPNSVGSEGTPINWEGTDVEVYGGELATPDAEGNLQVFGRMRNILVPGKETFEQTARKVAKEEKKQTNKLNKASKMLLKLDRDDPYQNLTANSYELKRDGAKKVLEGLDAFKKEMAAAQNIMNSKARMENKDPLEKWNRGNNKAQAGQQVPWWRRKFNQTGEDWTAPTQRSNITYPNPDSVYQQNLQKTADEYAKRYGSQGPAQPEQRPVQPRPGGFRFDLNPVPRQDEPVWPLPFNWNYNPQPAPQPAPVTPPPPTPRTGGVGGRKKTSASMSLRGMVPVPPQVYTESMIGPEERPDQPAAGPAPSWKDVLRERGLAPGSEPYQQSNQEKKTEADKRTPGQKMPGFDWWQAAPEIGTILFERPEPVPLQRLTFEEAPTTSVSLQDRANQVDRMFRTASRAVGNNPAAQSQLAAERATQLNQVLGEEFRANQTLYLDKLEKDRQARLQLQSANAAMIDENMKLATQARAITRKNKQTALQSIIGKTKTDLAQKNAYKVMENLFGYRFDKDFITKWLGPDADFSDVLVALGADTKGRSLLKSEATTSKTKSRTQRTRSYDEPSGYKVRETETEEKRSGGNVGKSIIREFKKYNF